MAFIPAFRSRQMEDLRRLEALRGQDPNLPDAQRPRANLALVLTEVMHRLGPGAVKGGEFWPLCPFHVDHQAGSFSMKISTGQFHCFVCGASGGVTKLMHQLGFPSADSKAVAEILSQQDLASLLRSKEARSVRLWDLPESLLAPWLAFWPAKYLDRGHPERLLTQLEVGVDQKRDRAVFPYRDATGVLRGVQTRFLGDLTLNQKMLRWKWYKPELAEDLGPEIASQLDLDAYEPPRSIALFNEYGAFAPMRRGALDRPLVVNEGPGHVLRSLGAGYVAVGTFGTETSREQVHKLMAAAQASKRAGGNGDIILAFDGDLPGWKAGVATALRMKGSVTPLIAPLEDGRDPEDHTTAELSRCYREARPLAHWLELGGPRADIIHESVKQILAKWSEAAEREKKRSAFAKKALSAPADPVQSPNPRRFAPTPSPATKHLQEELERQINQLGMQRKP